MQICIASVSIISILYAGGMLEWIDLVHAQIYFLMKKSLIKKISVNLK